MSSDVSRILNLPNNISPLYYIEHILHLVSQIKKKWFTVAPQKF